MTSLADFKRKKLTLDAYDRITHQINRDREEKRAEVERKARETF